MRQMMWLFHKCEHKHFDDKAQECCLQANNINNFGFVFHFIKQRPNSCAWGVAQWYSTCLTRVWSPETQKRNKTKPLFNSNWPKATLVIKLYACVNIDPAFSTFNWRLKETSVTLLGAQAVQELIVLCLCLLKADIKGVSSLCSILLQTGSPCVAQAGLNLLILWQGFPTACSPINLAFCQGFLLLEFLCANCI